MPWKTLDIYIAAAAAAALARLTTPEIRNIQPVVYSRRQLLKLVTIYVDRQAVDDRVSRTICLFIFLCALFPFVVVVVAVADADAVS